MNRSIKKIEGILEGKEQMTSNLDMGNNRIVNVPHPRNPSENEEYENDLVTAKILNDYMEIVDQKYMRADKDITLDGKLEMNQHRISDLADPTEGGGAVTKRYVASRFQALDDRIQGIVSNVQSAQNMVDWLNRTTGNPILILKYEYNDKLGWHGVYRNVISFSFFEQHAFLDRSLSFT